MSISHKGSATKSGLKLSKGSVSMDRISLLPDDLLLKILSLFTTKDAVTTSLLSKRWCSLWKYVPKLKYLDPTYDNPSREAEYWRASRFVDKFLLLHEAPVLELVVLSLGRNCPPTDIETWIRIAISRGVCGLYITRYMPGSGTIRLPRIIYTCQTLVILHLRLEVTVDDVPLTICFRSLKVLVLFLVKFSSDDIICRLLSACPVLVDLKVVRGSNDNVKTFTFAVPSLRILTIIDWKCGSHVPGDDVGFVIKAPYLESLMIANRFSWCYSLVKMPYLVKADIKLPHGDSNKFKGYLISAKHVSLCLQPPLGSCPIDVFYQLVSLTLCTCSLDLFRLILIHAPELRVLRFELKQARLYQSLKPYQTCCNSSVDVQTQWEKPSSVPKCLISSLETVEWIDYNGIQAAKDVLMYLLENSKHLKTMVVKSLKSIGDERFKMLQELSATQRSSSKCRLLFS